MRACLFSCAVFGLITLAGRCLDCSAAEAEAAFRGSLAVEGRIVPARSVVVYPRVAGVVLRQAAAEGRRVKAGEVLAEIDPADYEADLRIARARLEAAQAHLKEVEAGPRANEVAVAQAELTEAKVHAARWDALLKRLKAAPANTVSAEDYEQVETNQQAAIARLQRENAALKLLQEGARPEARLAAQAEIRVAEAEAAKAERRLQACQIKAPIDGIVLKSGATEGSILDPAGPDGPTPVCEIADLSPEVLVPVEDNDIALVSAGQSCRVLPNSLRGRALSARVAAIAPGADPKTGKVTVRLQLALPPEGRLGVVPGTRARVEFVPAQPGSGGGP